MTRIDPVLSPQVHKHGDVTPEATAYAVQKLHAALQHAPAPVLRCWLTLDTKAPGDRVEAHVDVNGVGVHVHAVGATLQEASDAMQERLRSRLRRIRRRPAQGPAAAHRGPADTGRTAVNDMTFSTVAGGSDRAR